MSHSNVNGAARRVLQTIKDRESVLVSSIRGSLEMSNQLVRYQRHQFSGQGLVERVASVAADASKDGYIFQLTSEDQKVAADADAQAAVVDEIRELREEIAQLETLNNRLWDRIEDADTRIDAHEARLDNHQQTLYILCDQLEPDSSRDSDE
jgi:chromosome segregation ATPase